MTMSKYSLLIELAEIVDDVRHEIAQTIQPQRQEPDDLFMSSYGGASGFITETETIKLVPNLHRLQLKAMQSRSALADNPNIPQLQVVKDSRVARIERAFQSKLDNTAQGYMPKAA